MPDFRQRREAPAWTSRNGTAESTTAPKIEPVSHSRDEPTDEPLPTDRTPLGPAEAASNAPGASRHDSEASPSETADTTPESGESPQSSPGTEPIGPEFADSGAEQPVEKLNLGTVKSRPVLFVLLTCGFLACLLCVLGTFAVIALLVLNQ